MIIYCFTYFINTIAAFVKKRDSEIINIFVFLLLIFMSGTRYYMGGADVYVYENIYNGAPNISVVLEYFFTGVNNGVNENCEIGYIFICSIAKMLHLSYFGFTLVYSILFYVLMYKGLKPYVNNWAIFIALFMYKIMFYDTFISIRQGLTIAIFCFSLKYILEKKWIKYFILCYLAFLIHRGALILFPLYFVQYIPISQKMITRIAIVFAPTWFLRGYVNIGGVLDKIIEIIGYEEKSEGWTEVTEPINLIHTLECYIIVLLVIVFYKEIIKKNEHSKLILQLFIFTIPIFTLFSNWIVLTREKDYFVIFYGVILGYIVGSNEYKKDRVLIKIVALATCFIGMVRYVLVFDGGVLMDFTSFISEGCSIFM